jgi:hypothetical protein
MSLARAMSDEALSREILKTMAELLKKSASGARRFLAAEAGHLLTVKAHIYSAVAFRRYSLGATPNACLNALLKEASE